MNRYPLYKLLHIQLVLACLATMTINSCVEPFKPNIDKYESLLVVDAILTNEGGSCRVILTKSYAYDHDFTEYVNGATVNLIDENGMQYPLVNTKAGFYSIADSNFTAVVGESYKIRIETAEDLICESNYEILTEPVPIDKVYYEFVDSSDPENKGLQILLDIKNEEKKGLYFSWDYVETWVFQVPYVSPYYPDLTTCYKNVMPAVFLINSVKDYASNQLLAYPLYFIDNRSNRLYIKYSVLVSQYTLSESAYTFLKDLKQINEEQGTLYDKTPQTLIGNFKNLTNPDVPILGNFQVSGISTQRIFIEKSDLQKKLVPPSGYEYCESENLSIYKSRGRLDSLLKAGWTIIDTLALTEPIDTMVGVAIRASCVDCSMVGSTRKPYFWDEQ